MSMARLTQGHANRSGRTSVGWRLHPRPYWRGWRPFLLATAVLAVSWAITLGVVLGLGELVIGYPGGNLLGDITIPDWFAAHRTPALTTWSQIFTDIGSTRGIEIAGVVACVIFLVVTRQWRPVRFVVIVMLGEVGIFLIATSVIERPRPPVPHLDPHAPPTSAFPSGHTAASSCLYLALAIVVISYGHGRWRWLALIPGIAIPALVATSRLYRGEHHPTDVLGSAVLAALWLTATTKVLRPGSEPEPRAEVNQRASVSVR